MNAILAISTDLPASVSPAGDLSSSLAGGLSWGQPLWLWGLAVIPLGILLFVWAERRRADSLRRLVAARLQSTLAGSVSAVKRRLQFGLLLGALAGFVIALAAPRLGYTFEEAKRKGRDVLIAIDTSRSMLANDVTPNRLTRAKLAAQDLINTLQGDRVGLVAFAGSAFLQAPLTVDYGAVLASLNELDTDIIPSGGTNIAEAIRVAVKAFGKGEGESRCLILFTDGEELDADALAAARAAAGTIRIFTVGVGSEEGALIPVPGEDGGTEFVKDPQGNFVKSRLDEGRLREIAALTNGFYLRLQNGPSEMRRIVEEGLAPLKESEFDARMSRKPIERFQWPLGGGLALLTASMLINERRRTRRKPEVRPGNASRALLGLCMVLGVHHAAAVDGIGLYAEGKFDEARAAFEKAQKFQPDSPALHFNKAAVDYAQEKYDDAIAGFSRALAAKDAGLRGRAEYNLGTALLRRALKRDRSKEEAARDGDLKAAIQHFEQAEKLSTDVSEDAKANKEIARKALEKPEPPNQDQKNDQQKNDQQKNDQQKNDQQKNDQQKNDQQKNDQQKDDQQKNDQQKNDQQKNDQQKNDQQKNDQQKDDQQKDDQQKGDQQKGDQQKSDQEKNDQQKDNEQKSPPQDSSGRPDSEKNQQPQPSPTPKNDSGTSGSPPQQPSGTPEPTPAPSGEIKAQGGDGQQEPASEQPVEAGEPENPNEMSENQARALLDSLRGDDENPSKNERRSRAPVLRNW